MTVTIALAIALAAPAAAAERLDGPSISGTGRDYADMAARSRVEADVVFPGHIDPSALAAPDAPEPVRRPSPRNFDRERWLWAGAITVALIVIVVLFIRYGGMTAIGFRRVRDDGREGGDDDVQDVIAAEGGLSAFLDRLRGMADRPAALHLLIQGALERAGQLTGTRVLRSQTARDVMRRLPGDWPHCDALRRIVAVEEVVQFGGRPLSEPVFEECLALAEPLFEGGRR